MGARVFNAKCAAEHVSRQGSGNSSAASRGVATDPRDERRFEAGCKAAVFLRVEAACRWRTADWDAECCVLAALSGRGFSDVVDALRSRQQLLSKSASGGRGGAR